jgi:large subunit ribosomal protein L31
LLKCLGLITVEGKGENQVKAGIHPPYRRTTVTCACGAVYTVGSTKENLRIEVCGKCHPVYTGKHRIVDTGGRVERFKQKYGLK